METTKQRRPPQPPIPAERIQPGSRWQKNRAEDVGRDPIFVIVDSVDTFAGTGETDRDHIVVNYHNVTTLRKGKMPLDAFCQGSEHRLPDPEPEPAPQSGERLASHQEETTDERVFRLCLESAEHGKMLTEIRDMLRRRGPAQLELAVTK